MSAPEVQRELGAHDVRLAHLEEEVAALRLEMREVLDILNQTRGSWKTLVAIGGLASAAGAAITWLLHAFAALPLK
jgi:hypothetical protein